MLLNSESTVTSLILYTFIFPIMSPLSLSFALPPVLSCIYISFDACIVV